MQTADEILKRIFELQKEQGLSNQQLADAAKMDRATVARIKNGTTQSPSIQNVFSLAAAVGYQFTSPEEKPQDTTEQMIRTYEDRIARQRSFYNMLLTEKNRWLTYCFLTIGGLVLVNFLMVILLIVFVHS